jgi:hypothetical protein
LGGGKYSATALRSKATATTTAYMNLIGKTVQKELEDLGIADAADTLESDDEQEADMNNEEEDDSWIHPKQSVVHLPLHVPLLMKRRAMRNTKRPRRRNRFSQLQVKQWFAKLNCA